MIICVPTTGNTDFNDNVSEHFGSAPYFAIVNTDTKECEFVKNINEHHSHGNCHPLKNLSSKKFDGIVCGGIGKRAIQMLNDSGIKVYKADGLTINDIVDSFTGGKMKEITDNDACQGHGCH